MATSKQHNIDEITAKKVKVEDVRTKKVNIEILDKHGNVVDTSHPAVRKVRNIKNKIKNKIVEKSHC